MICYLAPGDGAMIRDMETAMSERPRGIELIFSGELKSDLDRTGI